MSKKRGRSSYDHTYHIKEIDINVPNKKGLNSILDIMKTFELTCDCDLYKITKWVEKFYPRAKERESIGIDNTSDIIRIVEYIREKELLKGSD